MLLSAKKIFFLCFMCLLRVHKTEIKGIFCCSYTHRGAEASLHVSACIHKTHIECFWLLHWTGIWIAICLCEIVLFVCRCWNNYHHTITTNDQPTKIARDAWEKQQWCNRNGRERANNNKIDYSGNKNKMATAIKKRLLWKRGKIKRLQQQQ